MDKFGRMWLFTLRPLPNVLLLISLSAYNITWAIFSIQDFMPAVEFRLTSCLMNSINFNIAVLTVLISQTTGMNIRVLVIVSQKVNEQFRLQLSPMYAHFNTVPSGNENNLYALGMGAQVNLSERYSLIAEYYPVLGDKNPDTHYAISLGLNIQTGGHVFQMFFTSTRWHLEQYAIAQNQEQFWAGDFRFGFNVNRIFGLQTVILLLN